MEPKVKNVMQCPLCQGIVDRYEHMFQCRDCGAVADLMTGIFDPPAELPEDQRLRQQNAPTLPGLE